MTSTERAPGGLRLPTAQLTALLGAEADRRSVTGRIDTGTARCAGGHELPAVRVVTAGRREDLSTRLRALARVAADRPAVVVVERVTDGLDAADRRTLLAALRRVAEDGASVLVDDVDPVAALAVAHAAVRVAPCGTLSVVATDVLPALAAE